MEHDELYHYGIKGMRWGVRRFQNKDGSYTAKGKKRYSSKNEPEHDDYKKAHSGKSVKTMSDAELRSRLNRLQMEQQYSRLSKTDVNRGKEFLSKSMKMATGVATATTTVVTLYNNADKIRKIIEGLARKR